MAFEPQSSFEAVNIPQYTVGLPQLLKRIFEELHVVFLWKLPSILAVIVLCSMLKALHHLASGCCGGCPAVQTCGYHQHHLTPQSLGALGNMAAGMQPLSFLWYVSTGEWSYFSCLFFWFLPYSLILYLLPLFLPTNLIPSCSAPFPQLNPVLHAQPIVLYCILLFSSPVLSYPIPSHRYTYKH